MTSTDACQCAGSPVAGLDVDVLESARRGLDQIEAEIVARGLQLVQPARLPLLVAALRDGDVDDAHAGFAHAAAAPARR